MIKKGVSIKPPIRFLPPSAIALAKADPRVTRRMNGRKMNDGKTGMGYRLRVGPAFAKAMAGGGGDLPGVELQVYGVGLIYREFLLHRSGVCC